MIRRSLTAKVTTATLLGMAALLGLAGFGLSRLLAVGNLSSRTTISVTSEIQLASQFHVIITRATAEGQTFALGGESQDYGQALALINQADGVLAQLDKLTEHNDDHDEDHALLQEHEDLLAARRELLSTVSDQIEAIASGDDAARQASADELELIETRLVNLDATARRLIEQDKIAMNQDIDGAMRLTMISLGVGVSLAALLIVIALLLLRRQIVAPIRALSGAAGALATGDHAQSVRVTSADEIGVLQTSFNQMSASIAAQTAQLEREIATANAARQEAERAHTQIADQIAQIADQQRVISAMSVPVLPLTERILVVPLVGALDTARLQLLQEQALREIERSGARHLLLDVTGISLIDSHVARGLIMVTQAARLLGAEVILVGIRPEVAQSIVGLGAQLDGMITRATLQGGISYAMGRATA